MPGVHIASHPLISHKMTILRDSKTTPAVFRQILAEITFYLGYEATRDIATAPAEVTTPMGVSHSGCKISESVAIIPILRAGLGMADPMLSLIPQASIHHIGNSYNNLVAVGNLFASFAFKKNEWLLFSHIAVMIFANRNVPFERHITSYGIL